MKKTFIFLLFLSSFSNFYAQESMKKSDSKPYYGTYVMIGHGFGRTYGGFGTRAQFRYGRNQGVGIHVGYGYWFNMDKTLVAGIKLFPYKNLFVDAAYGTYGTEYDYNSAHNNIYNTLAATFSIGGDWVWGKTIANGFNFAVGITKITNGDYAGSLEPSFDLGYVIRFAIKEKDD